MRSKPIDLRAFKHFQRETTLCGYPQLGVTYVEDCITLEQRARKYFDFDGPPIVGAEFYKVQTTPHNTTFRMQVCNIDFLVIASKEHIIKSGYFGMRVCNLGSRPTNFDKMKA